ncbi:MAG: hypothetical protein ACR2HV_07965 [Acidimicrobiales bacterium]
MVTGTDVVVTGTDVATAETTVLSPPLPPPQATSVSPTTTTPGVANHLILRRDGESLVIAVEPLSPVNRISL